MAIIRNTASALARGRIGNTTYYVANGQQVARQSKNNSNYGDQASRTESQQSRRVKWANLVNFYKACMFWMPKAFETKKRNQSDYNRFMQVNIGSTSVALTKDMAANGCAVLESFVVSQGSLQPIEFVAGPAGIGQYTDIVLSAAITAQTTIAALSADIIANNPEWRNGDNLAMILFRNVLDSRGYPYVSTLYYEFTLDTSSTNLFKSTGDGSHFESVSLSDGDFLGCVESEQSATGIFGIVYIHTRKDGGQLLTSSQSLWQDNEVILEQFSSQAALDAAIASYGVSQDVPLDPSFSIATILSVAVDGSENPLINGRIVTYNRAVSLTITGVGMNSDNVQLVHDGVRYTPLIVDGDNWTYILGDNGTNRIYVNGVLYGGVAISGIAVPSVLPLSMRAAQTNKGSLPVWEQDIINQSSILTGNCINYPYVVDEDAENFVLIFESYSEDPGTMTANNAVIRGDSDQGSSWRVLLSVVDPTRPAYLMLDGFIVFVFNYPT